ncbi:MAG: hypothetical protein JNL01_02740 [Bdellovibrionales bacterium]|nr:hypothetical protein [Bdellovibrionales bacterium]
MPIPSQALKGFIYDTVQQEIPVGRKAQKTIWKIEAVRHFEDTVDQIFDSLKKNGDPSWLEELCPYFAQVWPSGLKLAQVISEMDETIWKNQRVLELGGGLALPSMILAKAGAEVWVTDSHPDVPIFLEKNMRLNDVPKTLRYQELNWEKSQTLPVNFDWVIGSDILYDRSHPESLCAALFRQLQPGTKVLIADPGRPYLNPFLKAVADQLGRNPTVRGNEKEVFLIEFQK